MKSADLYSSEKTSEKRTGNRFEASKGLIENSGVTLKSVIVSIITICILAQIIERAEYFHLIPNVSTALMPSPAGLSIVLIMMLLNVISRVLKKRFRFSPAELVIIYSMVALGGWYLSAGFVGNSLLNRIVSLATLNMQQPGKGFGDVLSAISPLVAVNDMDTVVGFWLGGRAVPWGKWITPIVVLTLFNAIVFWCLLCIAVIIRRPWQDYERLTYPLTIPVLEVINGSTQKEDAGKPQSFLHNRLFYLGALFPVFFGVMNILHGYFPVIPVVNLELAIYEFFPEFPFNAFTSYPSFRFSLNWVALGIAYFVPLDVSFSFWVFVVLYQFQKVLKAVATGVIGEAYLRPQTLGAAIGLCLMYIWTMRYHLKEVWKKAISSGDRGGIDDSQEPLSYKTAFWGFVVSFTAIIILGRYLFAVPISWSLLVFFVTIVGYITATRARLEAGSFHNATQAGMLIHDLPRHFGKEAVGFTPYASMQTYYNIFYQYGFFGAVMPMALETFKLAEGVNSSKRKIPALMVVMFLVAAIVGSFTLLPIAYERGMSTTPDTFRVHQGEMAIAAMGEIQRLPSNNIAVGISMLFAAFLAFMHTRFVWFWFSPIGFFMAGQEWIFPHWGSFMLAWLIKLFVIRYGGLTLLKRSQPMFYGMIIGQVFVSILGMVIAFITFAFGQMV